MKSIFRVIVLRFIGVLVLSFLGTFLTRTVITRAAAHKASSVPGLQADVQRADQIYERHGARALQSYLAQMGSSRNADAYLVDVAGKDLATGADRSRLLGNEKSGFNIPYLGHTSEIRRISLPDRSRSLIIVARSHLNFGEFFSYYSWTFISILLLSWWVAVDLASPLRQLRRAVEQFGHGNLATRVVLKRKDEIGEVARAFNQMAGQIQSLLTAERRLLQDISHELRSPLARLSCAIELARTTEDRVGTLARVHRESQRLSNLVNQLLEVTSAEGDPAAMHRESVELNEILATLVEDCRIEADAKHCTLAFQSDARVELIGDRELLRRAVENVLRNAIRYAPKASSIEIGLESDIGIARLSVRDYGAGVPEAVLDDIFKPFFRVERHRGPEGVGLGLALAQRAISLHRGVVKAENAHPGLRVTIELPATRLPGSDVAADATQPARLLGECAVSRVEPRRVSSTTCNNP
ncbi:MAG: HAMP domain-containing protein [Acidobacteriaceae bacterium]|nr:HAMP domain-containing protein [Acidobacteriaceae bacterium]